MIRSIFHIGTNVIAIALGPSLALADCPPTNPPQFIANAQMLDSPYDPHPQNHNMPPSGSRPIQEPYCTSLLNAYNMASSTFQQQLDGLANVFIDTVTKCGNQSSCPQASWGLFYKQQQQFVTLPVGLWDSNGDVQEYADFEKSLVLNLLQTNMSPITISPTFANTNPDVQAVTILAILTHEMGHIKWWQKGVESFNCSQANLPRGATRKFADNTWLHHDNAVKFQDFGKERHYNQNNGRGNEPVGDVDKDDLAADWPGNPGAAASDLATIYDDSWASIFATVTPDEDFIETYKLWALVSAQQNALTSLSITWSGQTVPVDVVSAFNNGTLSYKALWIQKCIQWP